MAARNLTQISPPSVMLLDATLTVAGRAAVGPVFVSHPSALRMDAYVLASQDVTVEATYVFPDGTEVEALTISPLLVPAGTLGIVESNRRIPRLQFYVTPAAVPCRIRFEGTYSGPQ